MKRLAALAVTLLLLSGCVPFQRAIVDGLNEIGQSHDTLATNNTGILMLSGDTMIRCVILDVLGEDLVIPDEACLGTTGHTVCSWDALTEPTLVQVLSGRNVTATVTFMRPGDAFFRHEILSD